MSIFTCSNPGRHGQKSEKAQPGAPPHPGPDSGGSFDPSGCRLGANRGPPRYSDGVFATHNLRGYTKRPTVEEAEAYASRWAPWRSVAARILWHGYLTGELKPPGKP
jgi:hypothetical protein